VHYGIFCAVHGAFVLQITQINYSSPDRELNPFILIKSVFNNHNLQYALIALFISHGISLVTNFILNNKYKEADPGEIMFEPYPRIVSLHLAVLFGGFTVALLGQPIIAILLLIVIKTVIDLRLHNKQHAFKNPANEPR
jgi:hypothetical protein